MNYLDVLTGKTIGDFQKPLDMAAKVYQQQQSTAGDQLWNIENERVTRAMLAGKIRVGGHNIGLSTARQNFFTGRYVRTLNLLPSSIRTINLSTANFEERMRFKQAARGYFMLHQSFF